MLFSVFVGILIRKYNTFLCFASGNIENIENIILFYIAILTLRH